MRLLYQWVNLHIFVLLQYFNFSQYWLLILYVILFHHIFFLSYYLLNRQMISLRWAVPFFFLSLCDVIDFSNAATKRRNMLFYLQFMCTFLLLFAIIDFFFCTVRIFMSAFFTFCTMHIFFTIFNIWKLMIFVHFLKEF